MRNLFYFFLLGSLCAQAQVNAPSEVCRNERFIVTNESVTPSDFAWDFCEGDLLLTPGLKSGSSDDFNIPVGTSLIKANGKWYGFTCSLSNNSLFRLDFGTSLLNATPAIVNLGNIGGLLNSPQDIKVVEFESNYYAFVGNRAGNKLIRINFGNNIEAVSATATAIISGAGFTNGGVDVVFDGVNWMAALSNVNTITLVNLGSSPGNAMVGQLNTSVIPDAASIGDVKFVKQGTSWHGFIVCFGSRTLHRLDFGASLFTDPTATIIPVTQLSLVQPYGLMVERDNGRWIAIVSTSQGSLHRLDFGGSLTSNSPVYSNLGNLGGLANSLKIDIAVSESRWVALTTNWNSKNYYLIEFPQANCLFDKSVSYLEQDMLSPLRTGTGFISLREKYDNGLANTWTQQIEVLNKEAPSLNFSSSSICENVTSIFTSLSDQTLTSISWDFGVYGTSTDVNPEVTFNSPGSYPIRMQGESENGCHNLMDSVLKVYPPVGDIANFTQPSGLICTNNEFTFTNTTNDTFDGNLSYEWFVNDNPEATTRDLKYTFTSSADAEIKLTVSIPGCSDDDVQTVQNIQTGPTVGFTSEGDCEQEDIVFTNTSSGDISGFEWDFGNGETSTVTSPTINYEVAGSYTVSLETTATNGCVSTTSQLLPIYSLPLPNFQLALPPFSCSGSPSQFTDTTPNPTDSNITSWQWNFNDSGSSDNTSTLKNPVHTYASAGQYDVTLTATTNYGCENLITKSVTIAQSPLAEILNTPACDDVPVTFTTSSQSDIKNWSWQIGVTQFTTPEPVYVFNNPGSYTVNLNAVGNNNCIASTSKNVVVPLPLVADFTVQKNCAGQEAEFTDATVVYDDPVSKYDWNFGDAATGEGSPVRHTYVNTGPYGVMQSVTTASGCNYKTTKSINVGVSPTASFTALPEVGVPPLSVTFNNTSSNANHYRWNFNDGDNSTSTEVSPQFTFLDYGNYVVDLTAFNAQNCSHTFSKVITAALPLIDVGLENLTISENINGLLTAQLIIHNKGNVTLQNLNLKINLSGIEIQQIVNEPVPPYSSILYTLDFNIVKGGNLDYLCVEAVIAGDNNSEDNALCSSIDSKVIVMAPYPNPSPGHIHLDWVSPADQSVQISIYDPLGKMVFENDVEASEGFNDTLLNLKELTAGVYFLVFRSAGIKQTQRFVIQR